MSECDDEIDPAQLRVIREIVQRCRPILACHHPAIQGSALGELVALWIIGHFHTSDEKETVRVRARLLHEHAALVKAYLEIAGSSHPAQQRPPPGATKH